MFSQKSQNNNPVLQQIQGDAYCYNATEKPVSHITAGITHLKPRIKQLTNQPKKKTPQKAQRSQSQCPKFNPEQITNCTQTT